MAPDALVPTVDLVASASADSLKEASPPSPALAQGSQGPAPAMNWDVEFPEVFDFIEEDGVEDGGLW